jgi:imidazolonepropionase-like amidohydrolase
MESSCSFIPIRATTEQLRTWIERGGGVLCGTDAGAAPIDPTNEYALMLRSGMAFADILVSLTTTSAALFGLGSRQGRVATGFDADLVAFEDGECSRVRHTVVAGLLAHAQHGNIGA